MKVLGVDFGKKRVGLAISDGEARIAFPLTTIQVRGGLRQTIQEVRRWIESERVGLVVVGLPLAMDGSQGAAARHATAFAASVTAELGIPVRTWDERFSTREAERTLLEADLRRDRRREVIDQVAATLILQTFLDAEASRSRSGRD